MITYSTEIRQSKRAKTGDVTSMVTPGESPSGLINFPWESEIIMATHAGE